MTQPVVYSTWIKRTATRATPTPTRFPCRGYLPITLASDVRSIVIEATQKLENAFGRERVEPMYRLLRLLNDQRMPIQTSHCSTAHSQKGVPLQHMVSSGINLMPVPFEAGPTEAVASEGADGLYSSLVRAGQRNKINSTGMSIRVGVIEIEFVLHDRLGYGIDLTMHGSANSASQACYRWSRATSFIADMIEGVAVRC